MQKYTVMEDVKGSIASQLIETEETLSQVMRHPILQAELNYINNNSIGAANLDLRYPYCHVNRYGAKGDDTTDSTKAIQMAVDLAESYFSSAYDNIYPIKFDGGCYLITKPIKCFYKENASSVRPLWFEGNTSKKFGSLRGLKSTVIRPRIPTQQNLGYASAFVINGKFNGDEDLDTPNRGGTDNTQGIVSNVSFNNIGFILGEETNDLTEATTFSVNAIKTFKTRLKLDNVIFTGMRYGVYQARPYVNDMCVIGHIIFNEPKLGGLYLSKVDATTIEKIEVHGIGASTLDSIIDINYGSAVTIKNFHAAESGYFQSDGSFTPINNGKTLTDTKAIFKLDSLYGISIEDLYIERPLLNHVFHLSNVQNVYVKNYNERFVGNGFMSLNGRCDNIVVENAYRYSNITSEYFDIEFNSELITNVSIKNFITRNYFSEQITVDSDIRNSALTNLGSSVFSYRPLKIKGLTRSMVYKNNIKGEDISICVMKDVNSSTWRFKRITNPTSGVGHLFGTVAWNASDNALSFTASNLLIPQFRIKSLSSIVSSEQTSILQPVLVSDTTEVNKVRFYNASNSLVTSIQEGMSFMMDINVICNAAELSR